jgi:hypothetical protein
VADIEPTQLLSVCPPLVPRPPQGPRRKCNRVVDIHSTALAALMRPYEAWTLGFCGCCRHVTRSRRYGDALLRPSYWLATLEGPHLERSCGSHCRSPRSRFSYSSGSLPSARETRERTKETRERERKRGAAKDLSEAKKKREIWNFVCFLRDLEQVPVWGRFSGKGKLEETCD